MTQGPASFLRLLSPKTLQSNSRRLRVSTSNYFEVMVVTTRLKFRPYLQPNHRPLSAPMWFSLGLAAISAGANWATVP